MPQQQNDRKSNNLNVNAFNLFKSRGRLFMTKERKKTLRSLNESAIILRINAQIVDSNAHDKEIPWKNSFVSHKFSFVFNLQYSLRLFYIIFV